MAEKKGVGASFVPPVPNDKYQRELTLVLESVFRKIDENLNFVSRLPSKTVTATYTILDNDAIVLANGTFAVTLPLAKPSTNRSLVIKNTGSGTITVTAQSGEFIDGDATYPMAAKYDTVQIISDGTDWHIVSTK
jgi:archaellum component FlaG (FlaF/FlaG flagellin family)